MVSPEVLSDMPFDCRAALDVPPSAGSRPPGSRSPSPSRAVPSLPRRRAPDAGQPESGPAPTEVPTSRAATDTGTPGEHQVVTESPAQATSGAEDTVLLDTPRRVTSPPLEADVPSPPQQVVPRAPARVGTRKTPPPKPSSTLPAWQADLQPGKQRSLGSGQKSVVAKPNAPPKSST